MTIRRFCKAGAMVAFVLSVLPWTAPSAPAQTVDCACSSVYSVGDRVVAVVDSPTSATNLPQGSQGTVICGNDEFGIILIRWDNWTDGFPPNTSSCECPVVTDDGTNGDWYVDCAEIALLDSDGDNVPDNQDNCPNDPNVTNTRTGVFYPTIASAIAAAVDGDVLELGPCTFAERDLSLKGRDMTLRGAGADLTVIDGGGVVGSIFDIRNGSNVVIEAMTIRNGLADEVNGGGAIFARTNVSLTARDVTFSENNSNGFQTGAVNIEQESSLRLERCTFRDNVSTHPDSGRPDITLLGASIEVINCLFEGGQASSGNAVVGVQGDGGPPRRAAFVNCTFANPISVNRYLLFLTGVEAELVNNVFDGSIQSFLVISGSTVALSNNVFPGAPAGNIDGLPTFIDAGNGDYRLAGGSLGIDYADFGAYQNAGGGIFDLGGNDRTSNDLGTADTGIGVFAFLDAGAYEFQGSSAQRNPDYNADTFVDIFDITDLQKDVEDFNAP